MNSQQFKALSVSEHGKPLTDYVKKLVSDLVDIRTIEEITEVEILARKRAANILEEELITFLDKDHTLREEVRKGEYE